MSQLNEYILTVHVISYILRGRRGRDRMVVGFTASYAISAYHHWCCEFESRSGRGVQHNVIKFVSELLQVGGFSPDPPVSSTDKTDFHDITEIVLKVWLNTIKETQELMRELCLPMNILYHFIFSLE
jgi:hypothetical protein